VYSSARIFNRKCYKNECRVRPLLQRYYIV